MFADCYADARAGFVADATEAGGTLFVEENQAVRGPDGEPLFTDVARFGPADASSWLLCIVGTHGLEGFAGSAALRHWIATGGPAEIPADAAVLVIHAVNPWGFAHLSRTTEDNVDLNRNLIDYDRPLPGNPLYGRVHDALCPPVWDEGAGAAFDAAFEALAADVGMPAATDAIFRGQYSHPDGVGFGGRQPTWSAQAARQIVARHLSAAKQVAVVDWHTGLGAYGALFPIVLAPAGTPAYAFFEAAIGPSVAEVTQGFDGGVMPEYTGILIQGLAETVPSARWALSAIEFGTFDNRQMLKQLMLDRWLKYETDKLAPANAAMRTGLLDAFCPADPVWRSGALDQSRTVLAKLVPNLASW